jgi:hypothetical protein
MCKYGVRIRADVPRVRDDYVVKGSMFLAEAGETDPDHHLSGETLLRHLDIAELLVSGLRFFGEWGRDSAVDAGEHVILLRYIRY